MEGFSPENPLGLPRDDQGVVHQLKLMEVEGTEARPRCLRSMAVFGFLPSLNNGVATFNSLPFMQQIAAILIINTDGETRPSLSCFTRAPVEFREAALANSAHHTKNSIAVLTELGLGHIAWFLQV